MLTEGTGLKLGGSLNGLGLTDTDITFLEPNAAETIAEVFVDPLLAPQFQLHRGERLSEFVFIL